ncbi:hypothetical protein WL93_26695 [Burkholderia diffusa]|uniref:DNA-binding protein n=1 Tax=Burkholderia diffusa TaxID=488732 RepID=UPI00075CA864|nr:DNA-binding protein [Burkholderia diffusa]KWF77603.1 hypothetical protein WL93_26695 [Burkholderia diffusa]
MGRKALHTQEQVFEAADRLAAGGQEVTPTTLREALGGGSLTTIYRHLEAWEAARKSAPAPVIIAMPDAVKAAFDQTWLAAATEAGKEIAAIREKADAEIKAANRRFEEAVSAIDLLESEQQADADKLEALETTLAAERDAARQAATEAAAREAGLAATVEQMRGQIEALRGELATAHGEAEAVRSQHAAEIGRLTTDYTRQLSEQAATIKAAQAETDRVRGQLDQAQAKIEEISLRERVKIEEAAKATAEAARLAASLAELKQRSGEAVNKLAASKQVIEAELSESRKEVRALTEKLGKATGAADTLRTQVAEQQTTIRELSGRRQSGDKGKG